MATRLLAIVGSVTPPGRMLSAIKWMMETAGTGGDPRIINLADVRISFADGRPPEQYGDDTASVVSAVAEADAVILATPVYRGSLTGALKNLLDHLPLAALSGKPVGIVAMGATQHHYLGADWHLRDVLAWFGALVMPTSVYLTSDDFQAGEIADGAREDLRALAAGVLKLKEATTSAGKWLGPKPLAARRR